MVRIGLIGDVDPQATAVRDYLAATGYQLTHATAEAMPRYRPDLIIVAGYRRLIPPDLLAVPRCGTVGFHSAKLPEYPGRAPIPWTLVRGDKLAWNTLLYLDEGVDSGDVIAAQCIPIAAHDTPATLYGWVARSCVELLREYLPDIIAGTAPRTPQDPAKRGPLTTKDGWDRWLESLS